jgi:hypothetical protein
LGGGGELGTNTHRLCKALIIISQDLRLFLAGDSASRLSVGVAASRMRASGRASERASERRGGTREKKEQGKKRSKRRERHFFKSADSLSPAKRLLVGKFYLTGVKPLLGPLHFTSIGLGQNENQLQVFLKTFTWVCVAPLGQG